MKIITHNSNNLNMKDINNIVKRAKAIIVNDKDEILLAKTDRAMFLPGGHVDEGETYDECLIREIEEETGVKLKKLEKKEIINIEYYSKDYPKKGTNSYYLSKYFVIKLNLKPNYNKLKLTEEEKQYNFKVIYVPREKVLNLLYNELNSDKSFGSVLDTIDAIKEELKQE